MVCAVPQPVDNERRRIRDGQGEGLRHVLGGIVPDGDCVCRYGNADVPVGQGAGGDAYEGEKRSLRGGAA